MSGRDLSQAVVQAVGQPTTCRVGTVVAINDLNTGVPLLQVSIDGKTLEPATVGVLDSYCPAVGDTVVLVGQSVEGSESSAATWLAIGKPLPSNSINASVSYIPAWTSTGLAPAYGNGLLDANWTPVAYRRIDVDFYLQAGTTTNGGTGRWFWRLPFPAASSSRGATGGAYVFDNGTANRAMIVSIANNLTDVFITISPTGDFGQGTPQTLANLDEIRWSLRYNI